MQEAINSRLTQLLKVFKTKELSIGLINKEVELVRQKLYKRKIETQFKDSSFFKK
jgi:hypothetical protein